MPFRYTKRMAQLVARIDDDLSASVDQLVAAGVVESRSDAVRQGLRTLVDQHRRSQTADAIVKGYQQHPQTQEEVGWADQSTIAMIAEEPW